MSIHPTGPRRASSVPDGSRARVHDAATGSGAVEFSDREMEILDMICRGLSNAEIAGQLFLSQNTVKTHIRHAYRKIGASTRSQALIWALSRGFGADPRSAAERLRSGHG